MDNERSTPGPGEPGWPPRPSVQQSPEQASEASSAQPPEQPVQPPSIPPQPPPAYAGPQPPGGGQPPRRRGPSALVTGVIILLVVFGLGLAAFIGLVLVVGAVMDQDSPALSMGDKVGVVMVQGVIMSGGRGLPLFGGPAGSRAIMSDLRAAKRDESVKAVVLYINSPGGSAAAAEGIYKEVAALADEKPVIAAMDDVAASGGLYVACAADKILANGATMTGSIGVIMSAIAYYGLMEKIGVEDTTIAAGNYKDIGSPFRPMRDDEKKLLEGLVQDVYDQFVDAVAEGRDMDRKEVLKLADGRIFTGRQAMELGLVDEIGSYYDAIMLAAKEGKIEGTPKLKIYGGPEGVWGELFGAGEISPLFSRHQAVPLTGPMLLEPYTYNSLLIQQSLPVR